MKTHLAALLITAVTLPGCAALVPERAPPEPSAPQTRLPEAGSVAAATVIAPRARRAEAFDRNTAAERAAARDTPAGGDVLGTLVASLGNPAEQGFWLRSALVTAPRPGAVRLGSGAAVAVDLLPLPQGPAQLSLAAYRALGLGLSDLPQITVLAR